MEDGQKKNEELLIVSEKVIAFFDLNITSLQLEQITGEIIKSINTTHYSDDV